jgi:hypothetical protein
MSTLKINLDQFRMIVKEILLEDDTLEDVIESIRLAVIEDISDEIRGLLKKKEEEITRKFTQGAKQNSNRPQNGQNSNAPERRKQAASNQPPKNNKPSEYDDPLVRVFEDEGEGYGDFSVDRQSGYSDMQQVVSGMGGYGYGGVGGGGGASFGDPSVPRSNKKGMASFFEGTEPIPDDDYQVQYANEVRQYAMREQQMRRQQAMAAQQQVPQRQMLNENNYDYSMMEPTFDPAVSMMPPMPMHNHAPRQNNPMMDPTYPNHYMPQQNNEAMMMPPPMPRMQNNNYTAMPVIPPPMGAVDTEMSLPPTMVDPSSPEMKLRKMMNQAPPTNNTHDNSGMSEVQKRIQEKMNMSNHSMISSGQLSATAHAYNSEVSGMFKDPGR